MKKILIILLTLMLLTSVASAATLNVGPHEKYKTIQSAVNAAQNEDTIKVASGTYKETVKIDKSVNFYGTKYPKVYGFEYAGADSNINGFSITKNGVSSGYTGGGTIRNNYFYDCYVHLSGGSASCTVMNNQFTRGGITLYDTTSDVLIKGNMFSKASVGIYTQEIMDYPQVIKNTFKNCQYGVYIYTDGYPGRLSSFTGNKYANNMENIGWGTNPPI